MGKNKKLFLYRFIKRFFDIISSLIALIVSSPLWVIILIGIKLSSKGPVFYVTERAGKNKKPFNLYKFRSMHVYCSDEEGRKSEGGFIANADRIFPFGGFLRKSKLDELPQLLNILAGQMSVIGPRPLSVAGVKLHYIGKYEKVSNVRPGLACLDSLFDYAHGELFVSNNEEFRKRILPVRTELAKMYVEKQSIRLDLYCILRTLLLMFQIVVQKKKQFQYTRYETEATENVLGAIKYDEE